METTNDTVVPTIRPTPVSFTRYSSSSPRPPTPAPRAQSATPTIGGPRGGTHRTWAHAVASGLLHPAPQSAHTQARKDLLTPSDEDERTPSPFMPRPKLARSATAGAEVHYGRSLTPTTISCKGLVITPLSPADSDKGAIAGLAVSGKQKEEQGEGLAVHHEDGEEEVEDDRIESGEAAKR